MRFSCMKFFEKIGNFLILREISWDMLIAEARRCIKTPLDDLIQKDGKERRFFCLVLSSLSVFTLSRC